MKKTLMLFILVSSFILFASSFAIDRGSLHSDSVKSWREASYSNRLATSSDWVTAITRSSNQDLQKKLDNLSTHNWQVAIKNFSKQLEKCVSDIAKEEKLFKSNDQVAEIASICYISMYGVKK